MSAPAATAGTVAYDATGTAPLTTYAPDPAEATHHLTLKQATDPGRLLFNDTVLTIDPVLAVSDLDPGCLPEADPRAATCPAGPVAITLGPNDDTLALENGVDDATVDASTGNDQLDLSARSGTETVALTNAAPAAAPSGLTFAGFENVTGGTGNDTFTLPGDLLPVTIAGGDGADRLDFSARGTGVTVDLNSATPTPGVAAQSVENVTGTSSNDTLTGNTADNSLDGGGGTDTLRGGDGADTLRAGTSTGDVLVGGAGEDTFVGAASTDILALDGARDTITCAAGQTDTVVADLGANPGNISDNITNPNDCGTVTGPVRAQPTPPADGGTTTEIVQPVIVVPALGTPPLAQVLAPGKASVRDLTPPGAAMRTFIRQRIPTVLARGVRVRVTCKEACGVSVALSVDGATAKRLKLDARSGPVVIGTATATRTLAGNSVLRVKLTKKAKTALKATKRSVMTNTQVLVSDASGNGTLLSRHVTLVR